MSGPKPDPIAAAVMAQALFIAAVARRRGVTDNDVDAVVSEVVLIAYQAASAGRINAHDIDELRRWITVVTQRRAAGHLSASARHAKLESRRLGVVRGDPEERYLAREALRIIAANITPSERALFDAVLAGFTQATIAAQSGMPPGTVATRLLRARQRLLALLRKK